MPRFAGQTRIWYPVLAHVMTVAALLPEELQVYGLLHDAAESIVSDVVTTWKHQQTSQDEDILLERICTELGVPWPWQPNVWAEVKRADGVCLRVEAEVLGHYEAKHPSFLGHEWDEHAADLTRQAAMIPANYWVGWGYGGQIYDNAVKDAMRPIW